MKYPLASFEGLVTFATLPRTLLAGTPIMTETSTRKFRRAIRRPDP